MSNGFNVPEKVIYVCTGSKCKKKGGKEIGKTLRNLIKDMGLKGKVEVVKTECTDRCDFAPVMSFQPDNAWLSYTTEEKAKQAFQDHIIHSDKTV
ncbi:(2Fe-2S) ferredoxin domain-containing protein [Pontibacter roseus]|uniref:(2Fe-2S) ferredoxin domain-containing protein n=1 Tax=Pontibacter roseus TaxID=336989 RepID=UPI00035C9444|nr:(2Fe-2S) ferredoxin domain-containing protein [Pontibacter roseus]